MNPLLGLNPEQAKAVEYVDGPSLIFAGAGSGKTKVLTHKIAYLIKQNVVAPQNILAVTFTNKAAKELRTRAENYVGKKVNITTIGTFHSICARILRREIELLGYTSSFSIYDEENQISLIKKVINDYSIILQGITTSALLSRISFLKSGMIGPDEYQPRKGILTDLLVKQIYPLYQKALEKANAVDFDDLLILPLKIFSSYPEILEKYRKRFCYILVDEYQDTNRPQFLMIEALGRFHEQVCVVGDDDQSIYSWRGADIENILRFEEVFPRARIFKLEQNYRSTNNILKAASAVVGHNVNRANKILWSDKKDGDLILKIESESEYDEAARIASQIQREIVQSKRNFKDFAILYRTNAQSRVLEETLRRNNIVYTLVGGVKFYDRKEIKDILAYFNFFCNPKDDISFKRIINFPPRGIGKSTQKYIEEFANNKNISLFEALAHLDFFELNPRSIRALAEFYHLIQRIQQIRSSLSLEEWSRVVIVELALRQFFKEDGSEDALQRLANIDELINDISEFCGTMENPTLEAYLEKVSLNTQIDNWDDKKNAVSLMTLHSAKGLEFPVVFICGLNQGLLPLERDLSDKFVEEERRLFYVGLTRAMEKVFLSSSQYRSRAGEMQVMSESIFLKEIPENLIQKELVRESVISAKRQRRSSVRTQVTSNLQTELKTVPPAETKEIKIGSKVTHSIFGAGRVLNIEGFGSNARLRIYFQTCGEKTIVAKYIKVVNPK